MHVRHPVGLHTVPVPGAGTFARLFAVESLARALLSTVISLQALSLLGDARDVSVLFTSVGMAGLTASLFIPRMVHRLRQRWVFTLGGALLIGAAAALATLTLPGQMAGMLMRAFGAACLSIVSSLYILQYIRRHDLTRSEPLRLQVSAAAWTLGPATGVWIYQAFGPNWTYALSAATSVGRLIYFWVLRLREHSPIQAATQPPPDPIRNIRRFYAQPRLRLAWLITFGRSSWWVFFFIYTPIYMVQSGHAALAGAVLVSAGNAMLFVSPLFGRVAHRHGIRRVLRIAFFCCGIATALCAAVFDLPVLVATFLLAGALCCVALDALGNIPFLRSVRVHERAQMTSVFRTYIDVSELVVPGLFALLLSFFDLRSVFLAMGASMFVFAYLAGHLPRRMGANRPRGARRIRVVRSSETSNEDIPRAAMAGSRAPAE
jgi:MFS family permease